MKVLTKAPAEIVPGADDADSPHGTFQVILSTPGKDRDGEKLLTSQWKQPLPEHITFDSDHAMSVAGTVGSGKPYIDDATGNLMVDGTYASVAHAQEVRALVNEGHIRSTSVAFMTERTKSATDDGEEEVVLRELLNGAFVAIPANTEAMVLASKDLKAVAAVKSIQNIHDSVVLLGAECTHALPPKENDERKDVSAAAAAEESAAVKAAADESAAAAAEAQVRAASELRAQGLYLQALAYTYEPED